MGIYAISGAGSGIGAATRAQLEAAGHEIIGIDLRNAEIEADLSTDEGRRTAVSAVTERCGGRLDGLVTGAGLGPPLPAPAILAVNFEGSRGLLDGLRPALAAAGEAQVVQIGSNSTTVTPNVPDELVEALLNGEEAAALAICEPAGVFAAALAYAGTKTAITRWCRRQAPTEEWAGAGIRLNIIAPGPVRTPLFEAGEDDADYGPLVAGLQLPAGDPATPDLMAAWIVFMLSPAARFAVGSVVFVDGGTDALLRADDWPRSFSM